MSTIITKNSSTASAVPSAGDLVKGELAVNVTDKKIYTKDNSAAIVKVVGSLGNQEANAVAITGGTVSGITDLAVADGGTGASSAADARTNLGVTATGADTAYAFRANNLSDLASASTARTNLGLGTIATQAASNVTITGGSVSGITDLAVADGGTGASTAANARTNLGAAASGANSDITALSGLTTALSVAQGGTGVGTSTGTGSVVLSNSPTLVTPALGTPASATLTNATGLPVATGVSGLGTGVATFLGTPSSANLASAVTDETGTGALVFANSPTLVTPALGTPSSGTATNLTGLPLSTGVTGTLPIANGGTGQTTATAAFNALAPSQATNSGKYLTTDGTNSSWATVSGSGSGTVTSVNVSGGTTGLTTSGGPVTTSGTITLAGTLAVANGGTGATSFASAGLATLTGTETLTNKTIEFVDGTAAAPSITNVGDTNTGIFFPAADVIAFSEGGVEAARFDASGNLGIGTTSPAAKIHAVGSVRSSNGAGTVYSSLSSDGVYSSGTDLYLFAPTGYSNIFYANNAEGMRLNSTGLGIGTASPLAKLGVQGPQGGELYVNFNGTSTNYYNAGTHIFQAASGLSERARIDSSGRLVVGNTAAGAGIGWASKFTVDATGTFGMVIKTSLADYETIDSWNTATGGTRYHIVFRDGSGAGTRGFITTDGTSTSYSTSSDYRLKNITGPITNSGTYIDSLNPVEGTWKANGSTFVGLIAHEVQEASRTNVATGVKDGEKMQAMDYSNSEMIANMIAELKSLRARVAALESN